MKSSSSLFTHTAIGIPAGPLPKPVRSKPEPTKKRKSVAAIIRPVPRGSGMEGSLRIDPAQPSSMRRPHLSPDQLDEYVNWLCEKFGTPVPSPSYFADMNAGSQPHNAPAETETIASDPPQNAEGEVTQHAETATNTTNRSHEQAVETQPASSSESVFSPVTTESLIAEVLAEVQSDAAPSSTDQQPPIIGADRMADVDDTNSKPSSYRIDQGHRAAPPKAFITFQEADLIKPLVPESDLDSVVLPNQDDANQSTDTVELPQATENFITTVAQAIASVLTDQTEPELEQKVRSHFETKLQSSLGETSTATPVETTPENEPMAAPETADTNGDSEPSTTRQREIPATAAAWDVEDFRWPAITNQMIVSGGEALDQLLQSVSAHLSPTHQRVALAGIQRGEGTTSIAISLARWSAACGKNVLLVDGDMDNPALGAQIGLAPNLSWTNAISDNVAASEIIIRSQKSNLCIMPLAHMAQPDQQPKLMLDGAGRLIDQVREHFDLVLIDAGPTSQLLTGLSQPQNLVDATLLIQNGDHAGDLALAKARLNEFGLHQIVIAHNRAAQKSAEVA